MTKKQKNVLIRIIAALILTVIFSCFETAGYYKALYLIPYLLIGFDILAKAWHGIISLQPFDENFLMAVATLGALALGNFTEAVAVMIFYQTGELFQSYAVGKSRKNIGALMDIRPDSANIEVNGAIVSVDPSSVELGSIIIVQPGEKIPIDGTVTEGDSFIDACALTGESVPIHVTRNSAVQSGTVNKNGLLKIKTTAVFGEDTASKILDLVENASARKSKSENFISKFSRIYTPAVCFTALLLAVLMPGFNILSGRDSEWSTWLYRALSFLVTSCPCALVISIPLSFFAGIGASSRKGILIKGSAYMETLSKVRHVVFDKTGTLTEGVFSVQEINSAIPENEFLFYAASAEAYSSHPIASSIKKAYGKEPDTSLVSDLNELGGCGITANVDGVFVAVGNGKLMKSLSLAFEDVHAEGTVIHVAVANKYAGYAIISDTPKKEAFAAIAALKKSGIKNITMLTGDSEQSAALVASKLGIDSFRSNLLPSDKVDIVEEIIKNEPKGQFTAFCGDGINDAPVLGLADVGISMGAIGSDAAIEASDIVIMDDNPLKITDAINISKKCLRIVYENIIFAIGIKLIFLALVAVGIANMWFAVFADVGVMVIAVLNSIRALYIK